MLWKLCLIALLSLTDGCPNIILRTEWGAQNAKDVTRLRQEPAPYIVIHHSDTPSCVNKRSCSQRVKNIQNFHMKDRGWEDIGYNFLVGGDGNVYEGRGWGITGAHAPNYNSRSIGICVIGTFQNELPSNKQLEALKSLIKCAKQNNFATAQYHLIGHRQGSHTTCPGNSLFNEIRKWPNFDRFVRP